MNTSLARTKSKGNLVSNFANRFGVDENEVKNILKSTAFKVKDGDVTDEQMTSLMIISNEFNLNPFTREIYAYPDKGGIVPVVGVDGWSRIINEHPQMDGVEFIYSPETTTHKGKLCHEWIECVITRKDRAKPTVVREYFDEVVRSLNFATPWDTHPKRMHRHKTLIQCGRVAFGFGGIYDDDEAQRIIEKDITAEAETVIETVYLDDATFNALADKYSDAVASGRKTINDFIAWVEGKGSRLTEEQKIEVAGWVKQNAGGQVDDDFVAALNEVEQQGA